MDKNIGMIRAVVLLPFRILRILFRILFSRLSIFLVMATLLVASHTVTFIADLTYDAISKVAQYTPMKQVRPRSAAALRTENAVLQTQARAQREATRDSLKAIQSRTRRTALANVAAAGGEALPFFGVAVIVGATGYEMHEACATMQDLHDLQLVVAPEDADAEDRDAVCGIEVPTKEELWEGIKSAPGAAWDSAVNTASGTAEWARNLERPDFGATWQAATATVAGWFD